MKAAYLLILVLLASCVCSCQDPNAPATNPGPDSLFRIDRLEIDTLYWGETAKLIGRSFGTDPKRIKIFSGDTELEIVQVSETFLYFRVGAATSGELRVYKDDHPAKGTVSITIIPHADGMPVRLEGLAPLSGVAGDRFIVMGENLDVRLRDISVLFGNQRAAIDSLTKYAIYCRVPSNAQTDEVAVIFDHRVRKVGTFVIAPPIIGDPTAHTTMKLMTLRMVMPVSLNLTHGGPEGTLIDTSWLDDSIHIPLTSTADVSSGIQLENEYVSASDTIHVDVDLHRISGRYSGSVTIKRSSVAYGGKRELRLVFGFENAILRPTVDGAAFFCAAPLNPGEIRLTDYEDVIPDLGSQMRYELIEAWPFEPQGEGIPKIKFEFK